ncbi:protein FAR1-RELATED SEQUENCE 5-like [Arachis ipaensis]|uniref:protein FAR1-RELATED SEQUENCE 5-like n=1 Tax=Arachis ipaensis TaxID=130454 RepID=UPI0007AF5CE0|nr:protein FAR1-RELATED SEQUENCE 5-like [Arachis ipaensis]XP_025661824.1 protein FAR1-RELATED SEQUENCE 5-like [Arachis hypogaea]
MKKRKKEPRLEIRTGYEARMDVKFVPETRRWHIFYFSNEHNYDLLDTQFSAMLPAHRKISEADIMQMMNMLKSGISTSQIFGLPASQAGGYKFVGYGPRDMYNEIARQRRQVPGDAAQVLKKLEDMQLKDPQLYFNACYDSRDLLRNLFWSDGISQLDYQLFGDVIAFDATYKKNKYSCPLVIFSEVNHHNQTIVFAAALIVDETTDTYIWLLRQLMFVMKGKTPTSIIIYGAMAISNAIRDVFPEVRHRLCTWYLIRNATSNVGNPSFTSKFRKIMLGDYEIPVFKRKFFAGFRTTSRCEGLHSVVVRYVGSRYDLTSFVEHFQRCVAHLRFKEFNANYESTPGVPVMQTCIELLERFAAEAYTHETFLLFRPFLSRAGSMQATKLNNIKSCRGTLLWMVPEAVKRKNQGYGLLADMWSLECTVLKMLTGKLPYLEFESMQALYRIGKDECPSMPDSLSMGARKRLMLRWGFYVIANIHHGYFLMQHVCFCLNIHGDEEEDQKHDDIDSMDEDDEATQEDSVEW